MLLTVDMDMANNWSVGGCTSQYECTSNFKCESKDQGLQLQHISREDNEADIFTRSSLFSVFFIHHPNFVGCDEYMEGKGISAL